MLKKVVLKKVAKAAKKHVEQLGNSSSASGTAGSSSNNLTSFASSMLGKVVPKPTSSKPAYGQHQAPYPHEWQHSYHHGFMYPPPPPPPPPPPTPGPPPPPGPPPSYSIHYHVPNNGHVYDAAPPPAPAPYLPHAPSHVLYPHPVGVAPSSGPSSYYYQQANVYPPAGPPPDSSPSPGAEVDPSVSSSAAASAANPSWVHRTSNNTAHYNGQNGIFNPAISNEANVLRSDNVALQARLDDALERIQQLEGQGVDTATSNTNAGLEEENEEQSDEERCCIDLEPFRPGDKVVRFPCMCMFHYDCVMEYLRNGSMTCCPIDRTEVPEDDVESLPVWVLGEEVAA